MYHKLKQLIKLLQNKDYEYFEEVHALGEMGANHFVDIVTFKMLVEKEPSMKAIFLS